MCNRSRKTSILGSCYEEETFKPSLTKQLLNMLKLWCEWSLNQRSERYNLGDWGGGDWGIGGGVGGFGCVTIKIYLIPHKVLQHSYGPPSMVVS